jgi:hypothetical protein
LLGPLVLITWQFLTALVALRFKVWRAFRFRHSGLTSVFSTLVLRPFQVIFLRHGYVSLSCIPSGLLLFALGSVRDTIAG